MDTQVSLERNRKTYDRKIKKFLTNTDKSVYNLKWEVGGVEHKNYQRNKSQSPRDKQINNTQSELPKRRHYQPKVINQSTPVTNYDTPQEQPAVNYYPYAYPPMPVQEQESDRTTQKLNKSRALRQSDRSVNLVQNTNQLKIEHHYVDSPSEAQRLIEDLRRRGFIETGIETPGTYSHQKRN